MSAQQLPGPLVGDRLVERWTRLYTRRLGDETARARRDEIASDLYDHVAAARAAGASPAATSRAIAVRMLLGVPADLSWRRHHLHDGRRAGRKENAMARSSPGQASRPAVVAGVVVVCWILLVGVASTAGSLANGWPTPWVSVALVVGVLGLALLGLARLIRGRTDGAFMLAVAAVVSTLWFVWLPVIPGVGLGLAAGLVWYGLRARSAQPVGQRVTS